MQFIEFAFQIVGGAVTTEGVGVSAPVLVMGMQLMRSWRSRVCMRLNFV